MKQHDYVADAPVTTKELLSFMWWGVNLLVAFTVFIIVECSWAEPGPNVERFWQHPGWLIAVGWSSVWALIQMVRFLGVIVRGPRQIKAKETL